MSTTRALVFDADGVLINPTWQFANHLKEVYGLDREATKNFFAGPFLDCLEGRADLLAKLPPFIDQWGIPLSVIQFVETWFELEKNFDQRLLNRIASMRQNGIPCYLATNQEKNRAQYMIEKMQIGSYFDDLFFSHALGCRKPNIDYYSAVTKKIDLLPEEILFFDDSREFVEGAKQAGWKTVHYLRVESLEEGLRHHELVTEGIR